MLEIKRNKNDEREYIILMDILKELLNINNNYTLFDLKDIINLEIFKSKLKTIMIKDVYGNCYNNMINHMENQNIKSSDNNKIKYLILFFMKYNIKYKFNMIRQYIKINFINYYINDTLILKILRKLKKEGYILYKLSTDKSHNGFWIKVKDYNFYKL